MSYTELTFNIMICDVFFISQVLHTVEVNFMLVHCMRTLDTTSFEHTVESRYNEL